ncbi:TetR family transcriptional regulator [Cryobacterium arcticum]|uniref:TetR family transcriptional regulator n=2 Tax=Cryobacterium arcticum TaxID=670052 RepID=A0A318A589_9MICO|nr:TetR family transcriptional regulator [Cryobacterium arcticum]
MHSSPKKSSAARDRLLRVASGLFYREGIHTIGLDRVLAEAGVTRATMYRHFAGKEGLVLAYLGEEDAALRALFAEGASSAAEAADLLDVLIGGIADDISQHHTRGCPFINAAAEYPNATSPVRKLVASHRDWFRDTLEQVLVAAGAEDPAAGAASLVLLRDAALVGGYLDGVEQTKTAFERTARKVLA